VPPDTRQLVHHDGKPRQVSSAPTPLDCGGMTPLSLRRDPSVQRQMFPDVGAKAPSCRRSPNWAFATL
jgi:hypothetical protein